MFNPKQYTVPKAKPIPVCLLLDVSYSMEGEKIDALNKAVKQMLYAFKKEEKMEVEILLAIITFGESVDLYVPFTKASKVKFQPLVVSGMTPMGTALRMAKDMIEDKQTTPSRAYRPTIILVSDGQPNDDWQRPLEAFINSGRSSKCDRIAMAIGQDADIEILESFIQNTPHKVLEAQEASDIPSLFQQITMSVTQRLHSQNPNQVAGVMPTSKLNLNQGDMDDDDEAFF